MKKEKIAYWLTTGWVLCVMTVSGLLALVQAPPMMRGLAHLGYPPYFSTLLGFGKLAGVGVVLAPGMLKLKEWAYVGFGITILSAAYSHLWSGDGLMSIDPLLTFVALVVSYRTRPVSRRFKFPVPFKTAA